MAKLTGGKMLAQINKANPNMGALISKMIDAHNHVASQAGVDPVGQASAPPPPQGVTPTVIGEQLHLRITDNNPTNRTRNYFSEVYADPQYTQLLHVQDHGASRDAVVNLPTTNPAGGSNQYYLRSYSQVPGSPPSTPVPFTSPITMAGTTVGTVPQSAGSGTGSANGSQPGQGYGKFPTRKATGAKRTV